MHVRSFESRKVKSKKKYTKLTVQKGHAGGWEKVLFREIVLCPSDGRNSASVKGVYGYLI